MSTGRVLARFCWKCWSFTKLKKLYHFKRSLLQKSLKSCLSSASLIWSCVGAKSNLSSNILISVSVNTLWLRLKIVSEQNYPVNLLSDVMRLFWKESLTCYLIPWDVFSDPLKRFHRTNHLISVIFSHQNSDLSLLAY